MSKEEAVYKLFSLCGAVALMLGIAYLISTYFEWDFTTVLAIGTLASLMSHKVYKHD